MPASDDDDDEDEDYEVEPDPISSRRRPAAFAEKKGKLIGDSRSSGGSSSEGSTDSEDDEVIVPDDVPARDSTSPQRSPLDVMSFSSMSEDKPASADTSHEENRVDISDEQDEIIKTPTGMFAD